MTVNGTAANDKDNEALKKKKFMHTVTLFIFLLIFFILVPSGLYVNKYLKDRAKYMEYQSEAAGTLAEFNKLSVHLDSTASDRYQKELKELESRVSAFLTKHKVYDTEAPPYSYKAIKYNIKLLSGLAERWSVAIKSGNPEQLSLTEAFIKKGRNVSENHIKLTLSLMQEITREEFLNILDELDRTEALWESDEKEFEDRIASLK